MELISEILIFGTIKGCIYALIATGFTLIFAVAGILNLAHGTFFMLGAYISYSLFYSAQLPLLPAILLSAVCVGVLGVMLDAFLIRPMRESHSYVLVLTVAVAFAVQEIILLVYGSQGRNIPNLIEGSTQLFGVTLSWHQIAVIFITLIVLALLLIALKKTKYGVAALALSMDETGARFVGIESERIFRLVMFVSAFLAALAGAIIAPILSITPLMWDMPLMKAFVIVVMGGLGSVLGSVLAAFLLGWVETFVGFLISPNVTGVLSLVILIGFLFFRPSGILGRRI